MRILTIMPSSRLRLRTSMLICLLGVFVVWGMHRTVFAQASDLTRVLDARIDDDNQLIVTVQSSRDVQDATLMLDDGSEFTLTQDAVPVDHWLLLDSGIGMLNATAVVRDEILSLVDGAREQTRIGLYSATTTPMTLSPTNNAMQVADWLDGYQASSPDAGCLLDQLAQIPFSENRATFITVVTAADADCLETQITMEFPVDIIQIGATEFSNDTVGVQFSSSILGLPQTFQAMPSTRNTMIQTFVAPIESQIESASVTLSFTDGESVSLEIVPRGEYQVAPTPTAPLSETDTPEVTVASVVNPTDVPTEVASPELIATDVPETTETTTSNNNGILIFVGGVGAIVVVLLVMANQLGWLRRDSVTDNTLMTDTVLGGNLDQTLPPETSVTARLNQTVPASVREMASQLGETHVANLINDAADTIYEIHKPQSMLGRQIGSDILIADDQQISREHVRFDTRDGTVWLVRLTNNPILVNGNPIENTRQLSDGDVVQLSPNLMVTFSSDIEGDV